MSTLELEGTDPPGVPNALEELLEGLFVLLRTATSQGPGSPAMKQVCESACLKVRAVVPQFSLQFVRGLVFKDGNLIPLTPRTHAMSQATARTLAHASIHELTFLREPVPEEFLRLAAELVRSSRPKNQTLSLDLPNIAWRCIEGSLRGGDLLSLDPEMFAASQLALAIAEVEAIMMSATEEWEFRRGVSAIRRIERLVVAGSLPVVRALEIAPGGWTTAKRAVAACVHLLSAALRLRVAPISYRPAAHALLATACFGYQPREGLLWQQAVVVTHSHTVGAAADGKKGPELHRLRTCALLDRLVSIEQQPADQANPPLLSFIAFCYELERLRCPTDLSYELTITDSLALLWPTASGDGLGIMYKALVSAYGFVPPGSRVVLSDRRVGFVLEAPAETPLLPIVLVDGRVEAALRPVSLLSPNILYPEIAVASDRDRDGGWYP